MISFSNNSFTKAIYTRCILVFIGIIEWLCYRLIFRIIWLIFNLTLQIKIYSLFAYLSIIAMLCISLCIVFVNEHTACIYTCVSTCIFVKCFQIIFIGRKFGGIVLKR